MVIRVVEFLRETKLDRFLAKNQYFQRKLLHLVNCHTLHNALCQKMPNKKWKGSQTDTCPENKMSSAGKNKYIT